MTSARKLKANRANAQASTGPITNQGKARAAQNARRHGLSLSILADPIRSAEVEVLACEIAGEAVAPEILGRARRIAEAQIDLVRIRQERHNFIVRKLGNPDYRPKKVATALDKLTITLFNLLVRFGETTPCPPEIDIAINDMIEDKPQGTQKIAYIVSELASELAVMDRYERRALSRRKFAIRALDALRRQGPE